MCNFHPLEVVGRVGESLNSITSLLIFFSLAEIVPLWQSQSAVTPYLKSKQLLPFGFARQCSCFVVV